MSAHATRRLSRASRRVFHVVSVGAFAVASLVGCAGCAPGRPTAARPTSSGPALNPIRKGPEGLYFVDFERSKSKGTLVELADFMVLLDAPISDEGGDATKLVDHVEEGRQLLRSIAQRFPAKPLRYVLSSHWHPHSLSALAPFFDAHVTVVTTRASFDRLKEMLPDPGAYAPWPYVKLFDGDSFTIADETNAVVVHRFTQHDYPHTPTGDYLYFELPRYKAIHVACMYSKWQGPPVMGRELITGREEDLFGLIEARGLHVESLIRLDREKSGDELLPFADLENVIHTGVAQAQLAAVFEGQTVDGLRTGRARLVAEAFKNGTPSSILNDLVYRSLGRHDLDRALEYATLQALLGPADANSWDTLGEVYFILGDADAAHAYDAAAKQMGLTSGGEPIWKKDVERFRKEWTTAAAR